MILGNLQEEFVPFATLRGSSTGVVARVESLPLASLGDFVRGRMGKSTRHPGQEHAGAGVEGVFESLLSQSFQT